MGIIGAFIGIEEKNNRAKTRLKIKNHFLLGNPLKPFKLHSVIACTIIVHAHFRHFAIRA